MPWYVLILAASLVSCARYGPQSITECRPGGSAGNAGLRAPGAHDPDVFETEQFRTVPNWGAYLAINCPTWFPDQAPEPTS